MKKSDLDVMLQASEADITCGRLIGHETLKKEIDHWRNKSSVCGPGPVPDVQNHLIKAANAQCLMPSLEPMQVDKQSQQ